MIINNEKRLIRLTYKFYLDKQAAAIFRHRNNKRLQYFELYL